jgi:hypothetical protein
MLQTVTSSTRRLVPITFQLPLATQNARYAFRFRHLAAVVSRVGLVVGVIVQLARLSREIVEVVVLGAVGGRQSHVVVTGLERRKLENATAGTLDTHAVDEK